MKEERTTPRREAANPNQANSAKPRSAAQRNSKSKSNDSIMGRIKEQFKKRPLIMHILLMLISGIALLIIVNIGLKVGTRHGNTIIVPDLRGMLIDDAIVVTEDNDLNIIVRDSIFDVDLPGGTVVDQLPRTSDVRDVTVKPDRKIYVTINAYKRRMVDVPYVAKQTLRQALNQLERSGLSVSKLVFEPDLTSTDYVLRQDINGNEITPSKKLQVQVGTGVTLYVSYHRDEQYTVVPSLAGLSLAQAKKSIWDSGLNIGKVDYDNSVEDIIMYRKAKVYRQSLNQNASAARGSEVNLYLSCNEELIDSAKLVAESEMKRYEKQRRKAEQERREQEANKK